MSLFGVDLGNKTSVVGYARRGGFDIALNDVSQRETPTVVSFGTGDAERMMGDKGLNQMTRMIKNTFPNLKRLLGIRWGSALHEHEKKYITFVTREGKDGYIEVQGRIRGEMQWFSVEQLLGMFLAQLRRFAEADIGSRLIDAVVTVPAYWTPSQRRRLAAACAIADYHLLNIMNETTAAALSHAWPRTATLPTEEANAERIMIVDIGHSTTTVSVVAMWRDAVRVVFHVCDPYVGVRDMIAAVAEHFAEKTTAKYRYDVKENPRDWVRFTLSTERAVKVLSANAETNFSCELPEVDLQFESFKRPEMEEIVAPQLKRIATLMQDATAAAGTFSIVEIIGGGSRIPAVKQLIRDATGRDPHTTLNASEAVAKGASINGVLLSPKFTLGGGSLTVWDASNHALCVMYVSEKGNTSLDELPQMNKRVQLLPLHEKLPKCLTLTFDRRDSFDLAVVHEPSDIVAQVGASRVVGIWHVEVPKLATRGKKAPPVKVLVQPSTNGVVTVSGATVEEVIEEEVEEEVEVDEPPAEGMAVDDAAPAKRKEKRTTTRTTTRQHQCKITQTRSIEVPAATISEWRETERALALNDQRINECAEARNELEAFCFDARARVGDAAALGPYIPKDAVSGLESAIDAVLEKLDNGEWDPDTQGFKSELADIRGKLQPYIDREAAYAALTTAESEVLAKVNAVRARLQEERYAHLTEEDRTAVLSACDALGAWSSEAFGKVRSAPRYEDPPVNARDVRAKIKELDTTVNPIFAKPVPKPASAADAAVPASDGEPAKAEDAKPE